MVQTFTQNEIIKAIYHELPTDEMIGLEEQLESNEEVEYNFESFRTIKSKLNDLRLEPSQDVITAILNYSKSYNK